MVSLSNVNASPGTDVIVQVYDIDLVNTQLPGEVILQVPFRNTRQTFQIRYTTRQYQSAEALGTADIQVQASTLDGLLAGEAQIIFNAPDEVIDIRMELRPLENPLSKFERLVSSLTPLMEAVEPADLTPEQISFLACDSRGCSFLIARWHEAVILNRDTGILIEAAYGWFRRFRQPHPLMTCWNKTSACSGTRWSARFAAISSLISPTRSTSSWRYSILPATHPAGLN
jgi:hypothetical protein